MPVKTPVPEGNVKFQHPLLIYPIFKRALDYLNFQDLLTCREVCSQWKLIIGRPFQENGQFVISGDKEFQMFTEFVSHKRDSLYLKLPQSILLRTVQFNGRANFGMYSKTIGSLVLSNCDWDEEALLHMVCNDLQMLNSLSVLCEQPTSSRHKPNPNKKEAQMYSKTYFTNLKTLSIKGDFTHNKSFFLCLLPATRGLHTLTYKKIKESDSDVFGTWLMDALLTLSLSNLTCLDVDASFNRYLLLEGLKKAVCLTKLSINIEESSVHAFFEVLGNLQNLISVEIGIIGQQIPHSMLSDICKACLSVKKVAVHCPCYPRLTLVGM